MPALTLPPVQRTYHRPHTMGFQPAMVDPNAHIPHYGHRKGYVPRNPDDFGTGGSFPEIHIKQYPLNMGRTKRKRGGRGTVALKTDSKGKVAYDEVVKQGQDKNKVIYSKYTDLVPVGDTSEVDEFAKPSEKQVSEHTEKTRKALERMLEGKLSTSTPRTGATRRNRGHIFVKYTPANQSALHNSGASSRIIKLHEMQVDPLEPPKFRVSKVPARPPSPPVPVMHSPPRKITVKDQQNWKVPPCVSNWKNNRGYVIPLHQRVAADGRHLQESSVNDKFAKLAESLYIAEREARKEVELRAAAMLRKMTDQKNKLTTQLRQIAKSVMKGDANMSEREAETPSTRGSETPLGMTTPIGNDDLSNLDARNRIREERHRERRRQRAKDRNKPGGRNREKDRDISEKMALGQAAAKSTGSMYDSRLFDRDSGMQSGFASNDSYNVYDKPLFNTKSKAIYKPTTIPDIDMLRGGTGDLTDTSKFKAGREFEGASSSSRGNAPVQFEKDNDTDPFGIEEFLSKPSKQERKSSGKRDRESSYDESRRSRSPKRRRRSPH